MRHQILCLVFLLSLSSSIILCQDIQFIDVSQYLNLDNRGSFGDIVQPLADASTLRPPTREQDMCYCVPYHECSDNKRTTDLNSNAKTEIQYNGGFCEHYLDVCCGQGGTSAPQPPTQGSVAPTQAPASNNKNKIASGCGIRNENGIDFNLNGVDPKYSGFGEFPWVTAIMDSRSGDMKCGGSLIHPNVILTGAHCVHSNQVGTLKIRAGEWDTQTTKERLPFQERKIVQVIQHPSFNDRSLHNDLALAIVDSPFKLDEHINTVCLPPVDFISNRQDCYASGWGKNEFGKNGIYSLILKKVSVPMVDQSLCESKLRQTRLSTRFNLHESFVCAGGIAGSDTCEGDGGAPLSCPYDRKPSRYIQVGVVAWGIGCNTEVPAVYANIGFMRNWIDQTMQGLGFDTSSYSSY